MAWSRAGVLFGAYLDRAGKRFSGGPPVEMTALLVGIVACARGLDMGMCMGMEHVHGHGHEHGHGHRHEHVTCDM